MDRIVLFWFLSLLTASLCYWMPTNAQDKERQQDVNRLYDDLSEGEKQFVALKQDASMRDLNDDMQPYRRKRVCSVGGGMSNQCAVLEIDSQKKEQEKLLSGRGPGKRRFVEIPMSRSDTEESEVDTQETGFRDGEERSATARGDPQPNRFRINAQKKTRLPVQSRRALFNGKCSFLGRSLALSGQCA